MPLLLMNSRTIISAKSKSHRFLFLLFSLSTLLLNTNHSVGQTFTLEPGPLVEKRVSRGERQEVRVRDARGSLQWQQSADGTTWQNITGKTKNRMEVEVTDSLFFRCAILEANCGLVYSDAVKLVPVDLPGEIPEASSDGNQSTFTPPLTTSQVTITTASVSSITLTSCQGGGTVSAGAGVSVSARGVCWSHTSSNPSTDNPKTADGGGAGVFSSKLTNLTGNTTYYVRAYAITSIGTVYGDYVKFRTTTAAPGLPALTTAAPTSITTTTAQSGGNITSDGGTGILARGVCWSTTADPTTANSMVTSGSGAGAYSSNLTGLASNTTYHIRAWARNSAGTTYGNNIAFTTSGNSTALIVTTSPVHAITLTSAAGGGNITGGGGTLITHRGVCWSHTSSNPSTDNHKTVNGAGTGEFTSHITGLTGNTTYYVRAYATTSSGTVYGDYVRFRTTPAVGLATVTTVAPSAITTTTAQSGGNVTSAGGSTITARGVCWSTAANPTTANSSVTSGSGTGAYSSNLTGLAPNTTYHVRAWAQNSAGTAYGNDVAFTASGSSAVLTITTAPITATTLTSASGGGNLTGGGASVISRGVCWSHTSSYPSTDNPKTIDGAGTGAFTSHITGLTGNTTYYVRAYAITSAGTIYGNFVKFKSTPGLGLATVTTTVPSSITTTTAVSGGNVIHGGGTGITARGVCWSTSVNPTTANSKTSEGSGTGAYSSNLTGLAPNTTYHVRAWAQNSAGTSYGQDVIFTTSGNSTALTVTTAPISSVTLTSAAGGGTVTGGAGVSVFARGVCWSHTSSNPSTDNPKTVNGAGTGEFTSHITGLTGNTTYYVRAYVTTGNGTVYGDYVKFKTTPGLGAPTVTTTAPSAVTAAGALSGGYISSDGGSSITARGVCWSTHSSPVTSGSKTSDGTGPGSFTSSISGLSAGTTYYVRAYATNNMGTSYGQQYHFTATSGASGNRFEYAGRTYTFQTIGSQTWMTENLAYLPSVSPPSTVSYSSPHYYVYNYHGSSIAEAKSNPNYGTYGVLYNWEAAKTACPPGWRLPSDADWTILTNYLGSSAGGKIKETGTARWFSPNSAATNETGFRALPAGHVYHSSGFFDLGHNTDFWTSTASGSSGAWYRGLAFNFSNVIRYYMQSSYGISVRCLKN